MLLSKQRIVQIHLRFSLFLLFGLWGYWHCGHSMPIVPASGDNEDDCGEKQMECRLAGETEVLGENLPRRHFCSSQNPTWPDPGLNPGRRGGKPATNRLSYGAAKIFPLRRSFSLYSRNNMRIVEQIFSWNLIRGTTFYNSPTISNLVKMRQK
jgi:hypothetical protein